MNTTIDEINTWLDKATNIKLSTENRIESLAKAIDAASDIGNIKLLTRADTIIENLINETHLPERQALLNYYRANIWSACRQSRGQFDSTVWDWQHVELEKEIFFLRSAIHHAGFPNLDPILQCAIETNLANVFSFTGRFVDAVNYWSRAIQRIPNFAMALGNRGYGLTHYARMLYDRSHSGIMLLRAYDDLISALDKNAIFDNPENFARRTDFAEVHSDIERILDINAVRDSFAAMNVQNYNSEDERDYRQWCLKHCLFLNPLNDLGMIKIADVDVLSTPDFVAKAGDIPSYTRFFNIMKQEYASARFLCYEGLVSEDVHYSDHGVILYNTLDYPAHSLAVEKVKSSFRMSYSLLDKVAQFINLYWELGVTPSKVAFRRIWYRKDGNLRDEFKSYENLPMRGLFWLSRDLFDPAPGFKEHTDPDARFINDVRNRLEHGFLSVHGMDWFGLFAGNDFLNVFVETLDENLYSVSREELATKTLRLLQMVRTALIYLSLAMHREEHLRAQKRGIDDLIIKMDLDTWEDDWKR